jgi:hypothetical protein
MKVAPHFSIKENSDFRLLRYAKGWLSKQFFQSIGLRIFHIAEPNGCRFLPARDGRAEFPDRKTLIS